MWYRKEVEVLVMGHLFVLFSILINLWFNECLLVRLCLGMSFPVLIASYMIAICMYLEGYENNEKPLW